MEPLGPATVASRYLQIVHGSVLKLAADVTEEDIRRQSETSPSIAFHVWHIARWADLLGAKLAEMTEELAQRLGGARQVWETGGYDERWGFPTTELGYEQTGMQMSDDVAAALPLPAKEELLRYVRTALDASDRAVAAIDDEQFSAKAIDLYGRETSVGAAVLGHMAHAARHLGMIEALKGVYGSSGTATV